MINVNDVDTDMNLAVCTWFPYQSSDCCTEVNDITLLESWVVSAQGHFTKNTDLFPGKISNSLNRCPMKIVVNDGHWGFITKYINYVISNGIFVRTIVCIEIILLNIVLLQMNMTFVHVPTPEGFEIKTDGSKINLIISMMTKMSYIALGVLGSTIYLEPFLDNANTY
jgi:hypothetical protein